MYLHNIPLLNNSVDTTSVELQLGSVQLEEFV